MARSQRFLVIDRVSAGSLPDPTLPGLRASGGGLPCQPPPYLGASVAASSLLLLAHPLPDRTVLSSPSPSLVSLLSVEPDPPSRMLPTKRGQEERPRRMRAPRATA